MSNHVFSDKHFDMLPTVVNHERHVHKFRNDRAGSRPRFDRFIARLSLFLHFEKQLRIDERAFLATAAMNISLAGLGTNTGWKLLHLSLPDEANSLCFNVVSTARSDDSCAA